MVRKNQNLSPVKLAVSAASGFACVALTTYGLTSIPSYASNNYQDGVAYQIVQNPELTPDKCAGSVEGRLCLTPIN